MTPPEELPPGSSGIRRTTAANPDRGLLRRAVVVLDVLASVDAPPTVRVMADMAGLSKSAVQRILVELEDVDLAVQDPVTRRYRLGPRALTLGVAYQRRLNVREVALPTMSRLCEQIGETVGLSVSYADRLLHVEQIEPERTLHARFHIGRPLPLWSGAPARVLLASRSDAEVTRILEEYTHTEIEPINPPQPEELLRAVELVRREHHARAFEETLAGVNTQSVPVVGAHKELAAVLSVTAPSNRLSAARMDDLLPSLAASAKEISTQLGYHTPEATTMSAK